MSQTEKSDIFCLQYVFGRGLKVTPPKILQNTIFNISIQKLKMYKYTNLVSKGMSPFCVKLNLPATGHRIGVGFFLRYKSYFHFT